MFTIGFKSNECINNLYKLIADINRFILQNKFTKRTLERIRKEIFKYLKFNLEDYQLAREQSSIDSDYTILSLQSLPLL